MVGENKILTVSYGTFSCTLEGFDDSFSTMKAIAEYFKGLAAEDRYFGAEPPAPDAEMLTRIAEREVRSRVEAKIGESGIVLRAGDSKEEAAPAIEPERETAQASEPVQKVEPTKTPAPETVDPTPKVAPFEAAAVSGDADSVAAKLQRIRAVVSRAPSDAPLEIIEDSNTEDLLVPIESAFQDIETEEAEIVAVPVKEPEAEIEVEAVVQVETPDVEETQHEEELQEEPVAESEDLVSDETPETEAEIEQPEVEQSDDSDASVLAGVGAFMAQTDDGSEDENQAEEYTNEQGDAPIEASDISSILGAVAQGEVSENEEEELVAEAELDETPSAEDLADLSRLDGEDETETADQSEDQAENVFQEPTRVPKSDASNVAARARARVLRVNKAELEEAVASDTVEEFLSTADETETASTDEPDAAEAPIKSNLSPEDEAELMAELAAVESEVELPELEPLPEVTAYRSLSKETDEDNVNRLMEESDSKFAESEGTRRRSAIAHLKAAVAATVADRKILGGSKPSSEDDDDTDAYRQDLADVVRPNRTERRPGNKDDRPAPLVLVSEQRIDIEEGASVRPRRVGKSSPELRDVNEGFASDDRAMSKTDKLLAESKSFAEFAERVGATELPDLLEAAAAYASFVEGREFFSRPDVMRRVLRFGEDQGLTREDGLRTFGLLLREGKIEKVKRGQFKIAESTRFNPTSRIAGE